MTTIINTKIGESKNVARLWLEGQKLARAGVRTGMRFAFVRRPGAEQVERVELRQVDDTFQGKTYNVSKRSRRGMDVPLIEVRSDELKEIFSSERVRVAIRQGRIVVTANHIDVKIRERVRKMEQVLKAGEPLKVCSLFHGGGVLDKALHSGLVRSGISSFVQVGVEIEPVYLDASLRNNPELWAEESLAVCSDIREMDWGNNPPQCQVLWAGVPCVGASRAGKSKNRLGCAEEHSEAGALFVHFLDAVRAVNPAVVLVENVADYSATSSMIVIRSVLTSLGYELSEAVLDGNDYGVLERRKRMVMVAVTKGMPAFDFARVTPVRIKEQTLGQVLEDIPLDSERWKSFDYLAEKEVRDKAAGKGFARQLLTGSDPFCGTIGRHYAKCRSTEPFLVHPVDSGLSRILTPIEHARVKGIPEEVIAGESDTVAHEILGQSVIFPKFEAVGQELGMYLTALVEPDVAALRNEGITSYCQQICGGGNCGSGLVCQEGISSKTEMPAIKPVAPFQGEIAGLAVA